MVSRAVWETAAESATWRRSTCSVSPASRCCSVSPTARITSRPAAPAAPRFSASARAGPPEARAPRQLLCQRLVGLAEVLAPLGVTQQHAVHAQVEQHGRGDLAGEGALRRLMHVLGVDPQLRPGGRAHRLGQRREWHAHGHLRPIRQPRGQIRYERAGLAGGLVHLPVPGHERPPPAPPGDPCSATTPGSGLPSISSSAAPPPVETWVMSPATPAALTAATESPPPTTEAAVQTSPPPAH